MKCLHKSNEIPPDMALTSLISETFQTTNITTSTGTSSSAMNDVLYIKHNVILASLNKIETQSMNLNIPDLEMSFALCLF